MALKVLRPNVKGTGAMNTLAKRLARCDREIAAATAESRRPHTEAEHAVILRWEMDRRIEREKILEEMVMQEAA